MAMVTRGSLLMLVLLAGCSLAFFRMALMMLSVADTDPQLQASSVLPSASTLRPRLDRYAAALALGRRDASVYGFGIAALWRKEGIPEHVQLQHRYNSLAERVRAIPSAKGSVYVYPFEAFHSTVAALVKFTAPMLTNEASPEIRQRHTEAWHAAITRAFASPDYPRGPGKLIMLRPTLGDAAAVFRYDNPGGEVATIRRLIHEAATSDPALKAAGVHLDSETLGIPGIIHSSFLRFTEQLGPADPSSVDEFVRDFDAAVENWEPLELTLTEVCFVIEDVPYMHGYDDMASKIVQRYPLG